MRFEHTVGRSYEDVGGGQVLYSAPGFPGFPPRLAVELFERARVLIGRERVGLWDPMCGAGGMAATLALLRSRDLTRILATDVSETALELAAKNMRLTTTAGLLERRQHLVELPAAGERISSVDRLLDLAEQGTPLRMETGRGDVTDAESVARLDTTGIDIVMADLPYGKQTGWESGSPTPAAHAFRVLSGRLPIGSVVVFISTERDRFRELPAASRSFKHGHRHIRMYLVG